jgi:iron complex transport system ATP-binding protein
LAHDEKGKNLISISNLSITLAPGQFALKEITTGFEESKLHALVGPNGSGKTTLIKSVAGLYRTTSPGQILLDKKPIDDAAIQSSNLPISYVESQHMAAFAFPVRDIILWGRWSHHRGRPKSDDHKKVETSAELLGISELLPRPFTSLSTGERKKTMLAQSLASDARLFVWDEPFAPLDLKSVRLILETIKTLSAAGATFVVSFHDIPLALRHADTLTILDRGKLSWAGPAKGSNCVSAVEKVFGVQAHGNGLYFI